MKQFAVHLTALAIMAGMVGCTDDFYVVSSIITETDERGISENRQINPYKYEDPAGDNGETLYAQAVAGGEDGRQARDRLQSTMMTLSDEAAARHLADILGIEDQINIGLGVTALTLDALAASLTPVNTKTALSAFSGSVTGSRALTNQELYHNAFGPAIIRAIIQDRRRFAEDIYERRTNDEIPYLVDDAIRDALEYHGRSSFYYGLSLVQQQVYRQTQKTEDETHQAQIENGRRVPTTTEAATDITEEIDAITDPEIRKKIYNFAATLAGTLSVDDGDGGADGDGAPDGVGGGDEAADGDGDEAADGDDAVGGDQQNKSFLDLYNDEITAGQLPGSAFARVRRLPAFADDQDDLNRFLETAYNKFHSSAGNGGN